MEKIKYTLEIVYLIQTAMIMLIAFQCHELIGETRALRKLLKRDLEKHQDWLFEQLCRIAPGKVLLPEQEESTEVGAVVVNPKDNPMNEFNGQKTDWFV